MSLKNLTHFFKFWPVRLTLKRSNLFFYSLSTQPTLHPILFRFSSFINYKPIYLYSQNLKEHVRMRSHGKINLLEWMRILKFILLSIYHIMFFTILRISLILASFLSLLQWLHQIWSISLIMVMKLLLTLALKCSLLKNWINCFVLSNKISKFCLLFLH